MPTLDRTAASVLDLVDAYEPGRSAVFAAPDRTILAVGNQLGPDLATDQADLVARVAALLDGGSVATVLAAIPFEPDRPAALVVPETVQVLAGRRGLLS